MYQTFKSKVRWLDKKSGRKVIEVPMAVRDSIDAGETAEVITRKEVKKK